MRRGYQIGYRKETEILFDCFEKLGITVSAVFNEDENIWEETPNKFDALEAAMQWDECWIKLTKDENTTRMFLVYGNEPGVLPSDWYISKNTDFAKEIDNAVNDYAHQVEDLENAAN